MAEGQNKAATEQGQLSPLEARIAARRSSLSAKRRELLQRILSTPDQTFFLSARKLAARLKVDPATVTRTVQALGYDGFSDFSEELRHHFVTHVTPYAILRNTSEAELTLTDHVHRGIQHDIANINNAAANLDANALIAAAEIISSARHVLIVADDLNFAQGFSLAWTLSFFGIYAEAVESGTLQNYKAHKLTADDVIVAIGFRRCLKATVQALILGKRNGARAYALTNSRLNPLGRRADQSFIASVEGPNPAGSDAACGALVRALTLAVAHVKGIDPDAAMAGSDSEYSTGDRWWVETD